MFGSGNIEKLLTKHKGDKVEKMFDKADKKGKLDIVEKMSKVNRDESSAILCTIVHNSDPDIRLAAVKALGVVGFSPAITHLRRLAGEETDPKIKDAISASLAALQEKFHTA